ncbi:uncharacterized protein BDV14DRAFT_34244 [Aspergillus stella-maris]|uniref:uncharacterized protein n=1 Tax=Aspergillus stella-maris TaxID=1810926 RepID=UPI003CCD422C
MTDFRAATIKKRATYAAFFKRQLFEEPPIVSHSEVDLTGKTAIVTGSNTGIGFECCRQLLDLGLSNLVIAVRTLSKGEEAKKQLLAERRSHARCQIEVRQLNLTSYDSITAFVEYTKTLDRLDIVINNAGLMKRSFETDPRTGHEETIQVNHLGNSLLVILLIPVVQAKNAPSHPGRITFVNSDTPSWANFKEKESNPLLSAFDKKENFDMMDRYPTSKLLGQLFLKELAKRVPPSVVVINQCNPGMCNTGLARDYDGGFLGLVAFLINLLLARKASVGARSLTDSAVNHGEVSHGEYIEDGLVAPMAPFVYTSEGEKVAARLWQETMDELAFAGVEDILKGLGKK